MVPLAIQVERLAPDRHVGGLLHGEIFARIG
jgi:hypothetical protein